MGGREFLRELQPRQPIERESALGLREAPYPSIFEDLGFISFSKLLDIRHTIPELRFTELDQTDPAGRWRWQANGNVIAFYRALTANWATQELLLTFDVGDKKVEIGNNAATDWVTRLTTGFAATTGSYVEVQPSGIEFRSRNAASSNVLRIKLLSGAATPDLDFTNVTLDLNSNDIKKLGRMGGDGVQNLEVRANWLTTDATAFRVLMRTLDPATDTHYNVAQAVPKAATPLWTMLAPIYTPTTAEVDATNLTFVVDGSDQLTAWFNKAGAMKSLIIGTVA